MGFLFLSVDDRQLTSSLFPYTTLFRSKSEPEHRAGCLFHRLDHYRSPVRQDFGHALHDLGRIDRKSTRLNSSHRCISYAVFCLKKKQKTTHLTTYSSETSQTTIRNNSS